MSRLEGVSNKDGETIASSANDRATISVVIPTRSRPTDLLELLSTILGQDVAADEVIIVDDSDDQDTISVVDSVRRGFASRHIALAYLRGDGSGLTSARNAGVRASRGHFVLFLDDDTTLGKNLISSLLAFFAEHDEALGVQPSIEPLSTGPFNALKEHAQNALSKTMMLTYNEMNRLEVRRSGSSVFPDPLTKVIAAQRLSGCCFCFRRAVFDRMLFDVKLRRWGFLEDLDFSFRLFLEHPGSLYTIPYAKVLHKRSLVARMGSRQTTYVSSIYWAYVFFKDVFRNSAVNLAAFLWALVGSASMALVGLIVKRKPTREWWSFLFLLGSYSLLLRNLSSLIRGDLGFLNTSLGD